jgi:hypothetical protein
VLIAGILALMSSPLFAASTHEVCDAMRHGCATIDALASCCCNGSDANASRVPSGPAHAASPLHAVSAAIAALGMPAVTILFVHAGPPPLSRAPDFRILFSDLRI